MFIRAYLRASTEEQDASRAKEYLTEFAASKGHKIAAHYVENVSGTKSDRPELSRLIDDSHDGDVILIEAVDRLTRLHPKDWDKLRQRITEKGLQIVSVDLPTSHMVFNQQTLDDVTGAILKAVGSMMLDMFAAFAHKDYIQRRERQAQGIKKAKDKGRYKGRPVDQKLHDNIRKLLEKGCTYSEIQKLTSSDDRVTSRVTISKVKKSM